jgi:diadenosine tetraphosphatase ApaH/serine/threonine PP2A family protein phosphatase
MGLIAIGDIHGCARTLDTLLRVLQSREDDHLVFIGDYIDRGPDSKGVISRLLDLRRRQRCTFLRGNHEALLLGYLDHGERDVFLYNGGAETLASYSESGKGPVLPDAHVSFIRETELFLETKDFLFVHAGLRPGLSVSENLSRGDEAVYLWERSHIGKSDEDLLWEKTVVCGHTPVPAPINLNKLINIDTGCVFHHRPVFGTLTAVRLPEREFVTVPYSE